MALTSIHLAPLGTPSVNVDVDVRRNKNTHESARKIKSKKVSLSLSENEMKALLTCALDVLEVNYVEEDISGSERQSR